MHPNALHVFTFNPDVDVMPYAKNKRVNFVDFVYRKAGTARWQSAFTASDNLLRFDTSIAVVGIPIFCFIIFHLYLIIEPS